MKGLPEFPNLLISQFLNPSSLFSTPLLLALASLATAADWPQFRGPGRDGKSAETGLLKEWPKDGPRLLWSVDTLGYGYSAPSVVGSRIYILGSADLGQALPDATGAT